MSHECPDCGMTCHCGGDIDDICFGETDEYCSHCENEREPDVSDEYYEDD
jgi:hypothetical protein